MPVIDTLENYLKDRIDVPVSRDELWRAGWGFGSSIGGRSLDVHIGRLRAALGSRYDIMSVTGRSFRGYMLTKTEVSK